MVVMLGYMGMGMVVGILGYDSGEREMGMAVSRPSCFLLYG